MTVVLSVRDVRKSFGALRAVDGVTLDLEDGEIHALIGPNGAGKTTLFNCVSGAFPPDGGRVFLQARDVTGWPGNRLVRVGIARTFQITNVFMSLPVQENVEVAVRSRLRRNFNILRSAGSQSDARDEAHEILSRVGLAQISDQLASNLAHGERRVLEVAIALAMKPTVLLLDEPTAGMSGTETALMAGLIQRLKSQVSILIVEHDMDVVLSISDRITVMTQGRVLAAGTPIDISNNPEVRAAYLGEYEVTN
jgi:branched-chain amino acid transport system ATP-binding protein